MLEDHNIVLNHLLKFYRYDHKVFESLERIKKNIKELAQQSTNKRYTQCPKCGSSRICFWMCHDKYGCYDCDWSEGHSV